MLKARHVTVNALRQSGRWCQDVVEGTFQSRKHIVAGKTFCWGKSKFKDL